MKTDRVKALLALSIFLVFLSTGITYFNTKNGRASVGWVNHTHHVIRQSIELLSLLKDAETGVGGYLLTDDPTFLEPYDQAIITLPIKIDSINKLIQDNKQQTTSFNENIKPLVNLKKSQLKKALYLYKTFGSDKANSYIKSGAGKKSMTLLRSHLQLFIQQEDELLEQRMENLEKTLVINNTMRYTSFVLIGLTCILGLFALRKKEKRNEELLTELNLLNHSLEKKVKDRTLEQERQNVTVVELNDKLGQSLEEIQSFYEALQLRNSKAEDTLLEIRDLYNNAPCGYHSLSPEGLIVRINDTELSWLGYSREEVVGKLKFTDIINSDSYQTFQKHYPEFKKKGFINDLEFTLIRKDGSSFPILLNSTALKDEEGNYTMSRSTVFDMTHRKAIENNLILANNQLVSLNEEKNNILGIAAHDLKSPLNGVLGLINLIKLDSVNLNADQREYIQYIEQSCIDMQTLILNLLDINRIEHGTNIITPELIHLNGLLHRHVQVFKEHAERKNITLTLEDNAPGVSFTTDPHALARVLENLISNALKFSPPSKEIFLRAIHHPTHIRLEVIDQGPGIRPEEMHLLFGKFQKLSARPTDGESSTGLGLAITKELVEALGGKISVESEVNRGTKFTIELPLQAEVALH